MSDAIWAAVLSAAGTLLAAGLTAAWGPSWKTRLDQRREAREILHRYRDPLLRAAFDLQSRLYNIVRLDFLQAYPRVAAAQREDSITSTLWLLGQYLGWVEILRREVQFLDLGSITETAQLQQQLSSVSHVLATDRDRSSLCIFRATQRAIGESMIVTREGPSGKQTDCLGFAGFSEAITEQAFRRWFAAPEAELLALAKSKSLRRHGRLVRLQRELVDLVDLLDTERTRYPDPNLRGRLPQRSAVAAERPRWPLAKFVIRDDEDPPWQPYDEWIATQAITPQRSTDEYRCVRIPLGPLGGTLELEVRRDHEAPSGEGGVGVSRMAIAGRVRPPEWMTRLHLIPVTVPVYSRDVRVRWFLGNARTCADSLLRSYHRPSVNQVM